MTPDLLGLANPKSEPRPDSGFVVPCVLPLDIRGPSFTSNKMYFHDIMSKDGLFYAIKFNYSPFI